MRGFPGASEIGVAQAAVADHVSVAFVAAPVSSTSGSAVLRAAPTALFQREAFTTPAVSVAPIPAVLPPTKLTLIVTGRSVTGMIWMPLSGARRVAVDAVPGVAVSRKPSALM